MMNKHVKHEHGLAALIGAFAAAFCLTAFPVLELNAQVVQTIDSMSQGMDTDRDGIDNRYDARVNHSYTHEEVMVAKLAAEVAKAAADEVAVEAVAEDEA